MKTPEVISRIDLGKEISMFTLKPENAFKWDGDLDKLDENQYAQYRSSLFRRIYGTDTPEGLELRASRVVD